MLTNLLSFIKNIRSKQFIPFTKLLVENFSGQLFSIFIHETKCFNRLGFIHE
jgi:hypothetical protein